MNRNYKCFVIAPTDSDGIIEAAICPALREYDVIVAHEIEESGTITKQILKEIYEDDLVVADLTDNDPNVMYELAIRHCLGKPTIMIAEKGTSLPSSIIIDRTIFYCNDAQGVLDLREELKKVAADIDFADVSSPIHEILGESDLTNKILESVQTDEDDEEHSGKVIKFITKKLNGIEERLDSEK